MNSNGKNKPSGEWPGKCPAKHPTLYQINTRILLSEVKSLGKLKSPDTKRVTLKDLTTAPEYFQSFVYRKKSRDRTPIVKFNYIYLLGVWQTGLESREVSRTNSKELKNYKKALPDFTKEDISGSPFAIQSYTFNIGFFFFFFCHNSCQCGHDSHFNILFLRFWSTRRADHISQQTSRERNWAHP